MRKTGLAHEDLMKRVCCLEDKGIVECNDNEIKFTDNGLNVVNELSDKALKMFQSFAGKINNEAHFPD